MTEPWISSRRANKPPPSNAESSFSLSECMSMVKDGRGLSLAHRDHRMSYKLPPALVRSSNQILAPSEELVARNGSLQANETTGIALEPSSTTNALLFMIDDIRSDREDPYAMASKRALGFLDCLAHLAPLKLKPLAAYFDRDFISIYIIIERLTKT